MLDITGQVQEAVADSGDAAAVLVYVPHTTAGLTIDEHGNRRMGVVLAKHEYCERPGIFLLFLCRLRLHEGAQTILHRAVSLCESNGRSSSIGGIVAGHDIEQVRGAAIIRRRRQVTGSYVQG